MYSYEKKALHCEVMANNLEKASKIARKLAEYQRADIFPVEKWERDKKSLLQMISELSKDVKEL